MTDAERALEAIARAARDLVPQLTERLARHGLGEIEVASGDLRLRVARTTAPIGPTESRDAPVAVSAAPASTVRGDPSVGVASPAVGFFVYDAVKAMLDAPILVAVALIVGGVVILVLERWNRHPTTPSVEAMGWKTALGIGFIQCLSMIPGVSRSGATIMGAIGLGVERKSAAEFSFFVAVPTMLAASGYDLLKSGAALGRDDWLTIAIGFAVSFVVALLVIKWFIGIVSRHGFAPFAWYRIVAGTAALVWLLAR